MKLREPLSILPPVIVVLVFAAFMGHLCSDILAQGPRVQVNPPDLSSVTQGDIIKTMEHRDELAQKRIVELTAQNADLKKQLSDLRTSGKATNTIVAVGPDLSKEIGALNSDLASEKRHAAWNLWKGALISFPLGIIAAIAGYFLTKGTVFAAKIAALV